MVDVYTKMKPDSFKLQLQAVLTAFYEDIKGVQGASGCPKIKVIKRRFADQEEAEDDDGAAAADSSSMKTPFFFIMNTPFFIIQNTKNKLKYASQIGPYRSGKARFEILLLLQNM